MKCKYCSEVLEDKRADAKFCDIYCRSNHCKSIKKDRIYIQKKDGMYRISLRKSDATIIKVHYAAEQIVKKYGMEWRYDHDGLFEILNL